MFDTLENARHFGEGASPEETKHYILVGIELFQGPHCTR